MKFIITLLVIFLIANLNAIEITEVELNPLGQDSGNEWVELYCEEETELSDYKIMNNDGNEIELSGSCSDYFVYVFEKQWLDNSDEKVFLYKNNELIYETDLFKDSKNDERTWQFCDSWSLKSSTRGEKNKCAVVEEIKDQIDLAPKESVPSKSDFGDKKDIENLLTNDIVKKENKEPQTEIIKLTKDIKSEEDENLKNKFIIYSLFVFSVLIIFLFLMKKNKMEKTEFENE